MTTDLAALLLRVDGEAGGNRRLTQSWALDIAERLYAAGVRVSPEPDQAMLRKMLPGIDALLVIDAADAGRVISARPDVWVVISAFLRAALDAPE